MLVHVGLHPKGSVFERPINRKRERCGLDQMGEHGLKPSMRHAIDVNEADFPILFAPFNFAKIGRQFPPKGRSDGC